ncbi:MAG TPA: YbaK/EbsC family protein [Microlunatus sp.]|nr:YbaK/EbsC family protein [Microlunatus sp.]
MDTEDVPEGTRRMLAAARVRGLAVELRERPAANSLPEAAAILGIEPADIAKTLVVRLPGGDHVFVVVGGDASFSWPKLRSLLGVNKMSMPDADAARAATGYERGTITPIGSVPEWPVYVDQRLVGRRVAMGAGGHGYSAFVDVDDLVATLSATIADLAA